MTPLPDIFPIAILPLYTLPSGHFMTPCFIPLF
jgi:hypothetical protein